MADNSAEVERNAASGQPMSAPVRARRPYGVTLLIWLVLSLSAWGGLRLLAALRWRDVLREFEAQAGPFYLAVSGAVWFVGGLFLLWSIWRGKRWSWAALLGAAGICAAWYWSERLLLQSARPNSAFALGATVLLLGITLIALFQRTTYRFLTHREDHERESKNTTLEGT